VVLDLRRNHRDESSVEGKRKLCNEMIRNELGPPKVNVGVYKLDNKLNKTKWHSRENKLR